MDEEEGLVKAVQYLDRGIAWFFMEIDSRRWTQLGIFNFTLAVAL